MRNGRDYIEALRDERVVYLSGKRIADVTQHPAFASAALAVAHLYDLAADPANKTMYSPVDSAGSRPANRVFLIPRTLEHHILTWSG